MSCFLRIRLWMLLFCAAPCLAHAQDKAPLTVALDKIVDGMDKGRDAPGGAVTVSIDNKIVYNRAFGSADLEHGVDFTPETVSETGSVAKQFTAAAILLLVNEGKLSLDDDIRKYFPELPDYGDVIQVRNLLTHTSGLKDWGSVLALGGAPRGTRAYIMADALACIFRQKTLNFPPGTMYFYSNSNYILLGELVHRVSKTSFTEFTRKRLFEPAGMTHTLWRSNFRDIIKNRAIAYSYDKAGKKYMLDMPFDNVYAAGGLLTTTEDLLKWNQCWAEDRFGPSLSEMRTTRGVLKNKSSIDYALGAVFMKNSHGVEEISHSGLTAGYRTWLACYPEQKISIAVLCNGVESIPSQAFADALLTSKKQTARKGKRPPTYPLNDKYIQTLPGTYTAIRGHHIIQIDKKNNRLFFSTGAEVLALSKDTLTTGSRKMAFQADGNSFLSVIGPDTLTYRRVFKFDPSGGQLNGYAGTYYSEEAGGEITIAVDRNRLIGIRKPVTRIALKPAYLDAFFMGTSFIKFVFDGQHITGFNMSSGSGRANDVFFKKM